MANDRNSRRTRMARVFALVIAGVMVLSVLLAVILKG